MYESDVIKDLIFNLLDNCFTPHVIFDISLAYSFEILPFCHYELISAVFSLPKTMLKLFDGNVALRRSALISLYHRDFVITIASRLVHFNLGYATEIMRGWGLGKCGRWSRTVIESRPMNFLAAIDACPRVLFHFDQTVQCDETKLSITDQWYTLQTCQWKRN